MDLPSCPSSSHLENLTRPLVLAVDDNEDNLVLLAQLLEIIEYSFITAADGQTTLAMAQTHQPNLILLDMMLPDISGIDVADKLRQNPQTRAIPIIAVTAMAGAEEREQFLAAGCVDYVTKPYTIECLEVAIRRHIRCIDSL